MTPISKTFIQPMDSCCNDDDQQSLKIEAVDAGGGTYVILSTERWAVEKDKEIDELCTELKAMLKVNVLPQKE